MPRKPKQLETPYEGPLKNPIRVNYDLFKEPTLLGEGKRQTVRQHLWEEYEKKVGLLFEHYGIDALSHEGWKSLALALAQNHVPGFRVEPKNGRKTLWDTITLAKLYFDIEKLAQKNVHRPITIQWICSELIKTEAWQPFRSAKNLQNQYANSQKTPLVVMYNDHKKRFPGNENVRLEIIEMVEYCFNQSH